MERVDPEKEEAIARHLINQIKDEAVTGEKELRAAKRAAAKQFDADKLLKNTVIMSYVEAEEKEAVEDVLRSKHVRSISGITNVTVQWMMQIGDRTFSCPKDCIYCPEAENAPRSYTGKEPASRRAIRNDFDPYNQVRDRLEQYALLGHPTDKCELIVQGGTFSAAPTSFQEDFIKQCFDAFNNDPKNNDLSLDEAQRKHETTANRIVGLTLETRPDFCQRNNIDDFLRFGCTRVEMGVQTLSDKVNEITNRDHPVSEVTRATKELKDACYKVTYHMMLGLPGETREEDIQKFHTLFNDARFQPDELKIYPTAVMPGTQLFDMWKNGEYEPLEEDELMDRLIALKQEVAPYCRIKRIMRDIPSTEIETGAKRTNLRQLVHQEMADRNVRCRCIRCREAGHRKQKQGEVAEQREYVERTYEASQGKEYFLSVEDTEKDIILGYLRLRAPSAEAHRDEIDTDTMLIRELKVVGSAVPLGEDADEVQHKGIGSDLMEKAEEKARENGFDKILVISAVGTREYYRKLGYERDGPYMSKSL